MIIQPGLYRSTTSLPFRIGDIVSEEEGRHEARVDGVRSRIFVKLTWLDTGWKSELLATDLVLIRRATQTLE